MADFRQAAATMLLACATIAWTATYSNSDSAAAAVLPLLLGAGLITTGRPSWDPRHKFIRDFCLRRDIQTWKRCYTGIAWLATVGVGVAVCVSLNGAVKGVEVALQLAAPDGDVVGAGFCGPLTCDLPPLRLVKAAGVLTQMYACNATDPEQPAEDVDCESNRVMINGIFLEAEFRGETIHNLRVEILQLQAAVNFTLDEILALEFDETLQFGYTTVLSFDDTTCPDGFTFMFSKKGILTFDVWGLRCNSWRMVGFVLAGSIEVVRQAAASQGVLCDEFNSPEVDHKMGERGVTGNWALTGESIRAIDNGLTLLFVGKGLGGLDNVAEAINLIDAGDDVGEELLDTLLEIRFDGSNGTILNGTERSCFVGGGGDAITIEEANDHPSIMAMTNSTTDDLQLEFSFETFTWVTLTTTYKSGFSVAEPRDNAAPVLAWISVVILVLCGLLFVVGVCVWTVNRNRLLPLDGFGVYDQPAALMILSSELAIISGSAGAAAPAAAALVLTFLHGCTLVLFAWVSLPA